MDRYLWILLVALLLASCSANDSEEQAGGSAIADVISYKVSTDDTSTRTSIANTADFTINGRKFLVWAFMNDGNGETAMFSDNNENPLQGVEVTYLLERHDWTTEEIYYWPRPRYTVDFFAVYPTTVVFNTSTKVIDFSSTAVSGDDDVMYATYQGKRDGTEPRYARKEVPLTFHHAFSRIGFEAISTAANWKVYVNSITLHNIFKNGTFNCSTATWSPSAASLVSNTQTFQFTDNVSEEKLLIPQTRAQWNPYYTLAENNTMTNTASIGSYIAIECAVYDGTKALLGECDATAATSYSTVYAPFKPEWEKRGYYIYKYNFQPASTTTNLYTVEGYPIYQSLEVSMSEMVIHDWTTQNVGTEVKVK